MIRSPYNTHENNTILDEDELDVKLWIEGELGERIFVALHDALKDGVVLCKLMNKLHPGRNKIKYVDNVCVG